MQAPGLCCMLLSIALSHRCSVSNHALCGSQAQGVDCSDTKTGHRWPQQCCRMLLHQAGATWQLLHGTLVDLCLCVCVCSQRQAMRQHTGMSFKLVASLLSLCQVTPACLSSVRAWLMHRYVHHVAALTQTLQAALECSQAHTVACFACRGFGHTANTYEQTWL